jgi:hypothetical protein
MKKLGLIIAAIAVSGAFELAIASNHHINTVNNGAKIYNPVTDTVPGKTKKKSKKDVTKGKVPDQPGVTPSTPANSPSATPNTPPAKTAGDDSHNPSPQR